MTDHNYFSTLIWQIADLLRGPYRPPQYERVMLPMTVLRRFDCVLAPTKAKVLAEYERRKGGKLEGDALDTKLNDAAGQRFHNHSPLDFEKLKGDHETARVDALVAAKERLLGLLPEKRRALITRTVTRGLDPRVPLRDSGIPWLGEIPAHWGTRRVAWLFRKRDERSEPDLPLLEVSINAGVVLREFSEERIERSAGRAARGRLSLGVALSSSTKPTVHRAVRRRPISKRCSAVKG